MITWEESFESAVQKSKDEKKLIVMDFYNPQ